MGKVKTYQAKFDSLAAAKNDAKEQSKKKPDVDFSIIQSYSNGVRGGEVEFYVEEDAPFIRNWETGHGYYINGKYHAN